MQQNKFQVGDCIILNDFDRPYGRLVCVVTGIDKLGCYRVQYLNADKSLDSHCKPPMKSLLERATKLEDFGVTLRSDGTRYWCERVGSSSATYSDGQPREWQERGGPIKYTIRSSVFPYFCKAEA